MGHLRRRGSWLYLIPVALVLAASACTSGAGGGGGGGGTTITVAVVANPQMQDIQKLTKYFEKDHPGIKVEYVTLPEDQLRDKVTQDVATKGGQYDVVMIGPYEVPIWAKNGWISSLASQASRDKSYDLNDIFPPIRTALSYQNQLYAVPFYGESSFLMYRKDLFQKAGLTMPAHPTWPQVAQLAKRLDDVKPGVAGICLRGLPGWGEVMAPLDTVINTFGGRWYDMNWNAQLTAAPVQKAVNFYVNLVRNYGQSGAPSSGFTECLTDYTQGKVAMWYDATVAASTIEAAGQSKVVGKNGYVAAPVVKTPHSGWLWSWALATESASQNKDAAWTYESWATGKAYIRLVGKKLGWARVPPGTRKSTYQIPQYQKAAAAFATPTLQAIESADLQHPTVQPVPYTGIQYVEIPQFQDLGTKVSQQISAAIAGNTSVQAALQLSQQEASQVGKDLQGSH